MAKQNYILSPYQVKYWPLLANAVRSILIIISTYV